MKTSLRIIFTLFLLSVYTSHAQDGNPSSAQKSKGLQKPPGFRIEDYSYPYFTIINNASTPITGSFIQYRNQSFFVTTRHSFYTPVNEKRKVTKVMIFIDPSDLKNTSKVLSLDMKDQKLMPVCFDSVCTDIVLLPVEIPQELPVNYVGIDTRENLKDKEMSIVGFVKDSLSIIKTRFHSYLERDSTYFLTEKSALNEQAGSPVLMYASAKGKGVSKVMLAGVYSGKELSQENFDKGLISTSRAIISFLDNERIASMPAPTPKPGKGKKNSQKGQN